MGAAKQAFPPNPSEAIQEYQLYGRPVYRLGSLESSIVTLPCKHRIYYTEHIAAMYNLCLNGTLSCVDFMDVIMGNIPILSGNTIIGLHRCDLLQNMFKPELCLIAGDLLEEGLLWCFHNRARQRQDKTNVDPVHSYDAFHTRHAGPGVKGIIGMYRVQHLSCRCLALV